MSLHFENDDDANFRAGTLCFLNFLMTLLWSVSLKVMLPLFEAYLTGTLPEFLVFVAVSSATRREVRIWRK